MIRFSRTSVSVGLLLGLALAGTARGDLGGEASRTHVLRGASVVTEPGSERFRATVVLKDGRIEMVGADVAAPPGAIEHDLAGRTLYPGWVEPYLPFPRESFPADRPVGTAHPNHFIRPETRAADHLPLGEKQTEELRRGGYTVAQVVPPRGILRGTTAIVALADGKPASHVLRADHAQAFAFEHGGWEDFEYPGSIQGVLALARQTFLDARWNRDARTAWARDPAATDRPPESAALRALLPVLDRAMPILLLSPSLEFLPRSLSLAREFGLHPIVVSERPEHHRRVDWVAAELERANARLVTSLAFPNAPTWTDEDSRADVDLDALLDWDRAPADLAALEEVGVRFAVTSFGLEAPSEALVRLRRAVRHGLSTRAALAAVTTEAAAILGIDHRVGTLEPGKDANLLVATGDLFDPDTEIEAVWVEGVRYGPSSRWAEEDDVKGRWELWLADADSAAVVVELSSGEEGLGGRVIRAAELASEEETREGEEGEPDDAGEDGGDTAQGVEGEGEEGADEERYALTEVTLVRGRLVFGIPESAWGRPSARFTLELDGPFLRGRVRDGAEAPVLARPWHRPRPPRDDTSLSRGAAPWPLEYDPQGAPSAVLVRGATVWTCGPAGTLENADLLVRRGRVAAVGPGLDAPDDALVLDGTGRHVTPGIVDCHSHSAISGGVNECTESCTAEVRIADVVNAESPAIYRELAGGLTVSNQLHGSCNTIGGQNAVIKLRWGAPADELLLAGAPPGIKFALGENVVRAGWNEKEARDRYPNTRMGVEQFLRDRLHAADDYRESWDDYRRTRSGAPPRPDLELDALVEVLQGTRLVHCHAYRADEIVMLMRVAEDFGFRVATFQHVLEGYKVANEMAAHGAGASAFSDWWSYKVEVIDAVPYAGRIMWDRGVLVSYNSDSSELSRRLNLEAAKAVKYGGVPEEEALKFVTYNPAVQLGIDERVGSLEPGKDGDFVIWSAHPLSDFAVCQQTWIDGVKRFDREEDLAARAAAEELRERLLEKAKRAAAGEREGEEGREHGFRGWHEAETERGVCLDAACGAGGVR